VTIERWLLLLIAVVFAVDAWYTRKWIRQTRRALDEIARLRARPPGSETEV
jgi:hypothetical protein